MMDLMDAITELLRIEVSLAEHVRAISGRILAAPPEGRPDSDIWCDYGFKWPAYTFAHLHRTTHPDNPHVGAAWCIDLALRFMDKAVEDWRDRVRQGLTVSSLEVPHYVAAALVAWLGDALDDGRRADWTAHAEAFAEEALTRPGGLTGNYHDTWHMLALYRMGEAWGRAEWRETALRFFHQIIALQTPSGFWEERRHHGPSMRYNGLMLPTLAWMYRLTDDAICGEAARKLAAFMATFTYPDAITVGPFDGRNAPMLAFFPTCPGLELAPEGRVLSARAFRLWRDLGAPGNVTRTVASTRDAVRLAFYTADTCHYLMEHVPPDEPILDETGRLPVDEDGAIEHHTSAFDGVLVRRGPWAAALSGQESEVPIIAQSPYRLERQSRIEVWHERARLVIGGGHNLRGAAVPYANAVVDTGYAGPVSFGVLDREKAADIWRARRIPRAGETLGQEPPSAALHRMFQAYYMPPAVRTTVEDGAPALALLFAHGAVRFSPAFPAADRCDLTAAWDLRCVRRLCIQVPIVVWLGATLSLDGRSQEPVEPTLLPVEKEMRVDGGLFGSRISVALPPDVPCRVRWPLPAHPTFSDRFDDDPFLPQFAIALVSCQWSPPPDTGQARLTLTVG